MNLEHQLMSYLIAHDEITPIKAVEKRTVTVKLVQRKRTKTQDLFACGVRIYDS